MEDLQKSISVLDDSLPTSKRNLFRRSVRRADEEQQQQLFDMTVTMNPAEIRQFLDNTMLNNVSSTGELTNKFLAQSRFNNSHSNLTSFSLSSSAVARNKTDQLFTQFLEILQSRTNDSEIFETVQDIISAMTDISEEIAGNKRREKYESDTETWLRAEKNTWKLLYCLYKDRLVAQKEEVEMDEMPLINSEKNIVERLYLVNSNLREYQLVVDWLEQTALEQNKLQIGLYTDRTVAWENTLHQLLQNMGQTVFGSNKQIVKSLDPDAPVREGVPLHDLDMEDQARLSRQIFLEIRQGRIEEAQVLCEYSGQPWRAALLEGWRLHHDPNFERHETGDKMPIEGNPRRDIWKKCAWMMADKVNLDDYTRAIAGALCGHLGALLNVLNDSWIDQLWAYLKVQIDIRVESEIRSYSVRSHCQMPEKYWQNKMALEKIFEELEAHPNLEVRASAKDPMAVIQKYLILDEIPELMRHIDNWISEKAVPSQMLRFLTHIVLFMRQIGKGHQEQICDKVIRTYVECLIRMGNAQLVAFYTAALPFDQQITLYAQFLEATTETVARKVCLEEAMGHGLDVLAVTRRAVDSIRCRQSPAGEAADKPLEGEVEDLDQVKISALEWLTFYPEQSGELLWQGNAMIRTFLAENKMESARKAFNMIPAESVQQIVASVETCEQSFKEEAAVKEYLCHKIYLAAIDGYNDWVTCFYTMKPKEPNLVKTKNFTERVASQHKEQVYKSDLERWKVNVMQQTNVTRDLLNNVLLFPDKGWLIDPEPNDDNFLDDLANDEREMWLNRKNQLDNLRKICIPDIVLLLHNVFTNTSQHQQCIKLADELASETNQLYQVFSKHKLVELLTKITESSLALMNEKKDPFGYVVT